jgi:hypothetical protein
MDVNEIDAHELLSFGVGHSPEWRQGRSHRLSPIDRRIVDAP